MVLYLEGVWDLPTRISSPVATFAKNSPSYLDAGETVGVDRC